MASRPIKSRGAVGTLQRLLKKWWAQQDSNLRPADYESVALPLRHGPVPQIIGGVCTLVTSVLRRWGRRAHLWVAACDAYCYVVEQFLRVHQIDPGRPTVRHRGKPHSRDECSVLVRSLCADKS